MTSCLGGVAGRAPVVAKGDVKHVQRTKVVLQGCVWPLYPTEAVSWLTDPYPTYDAAGDDPPPVLADTKPCGQAPCDGSSFSGINPTISRRLTEPSALATTSSWHDGPLKCHRAQDLTLRLHSHAQTPTKDRAEYVIPQRHF